MEADPRVVGVPSAVAVEVITTTGPTRMIGRAGTLAMRAAWVAYQVADARAVVVDGETVPVVVRLLAPVRRSRGVP